MPKAPKAKLSLKKYQVTIVREVEHRAVVDVEAETEDVAKQMAEIVADEPRSGCWVEGHIISSTIRAKEIKA